MKVGNYEPFIVKSIYRPPGKTVDHFNDIDALFSIIEAEEKESIYLGDTNCDMPDLTNNDKKNLKRLLTKFNLTQLIKSPIRSTATSKTIINHIITNRLEAASKSGVLACGISDHDVVFMTKHMRLPKLKASPAGYLMSETIKSSILMLLDKIMNNVQFDKIRSILKDASEMWILWKAFFLDILNKHAPIINIKVKGNNIPYVISELKGMIRQRDYLRAKAKNTGSRILRQAYNQIKTKVSQKFYSIGKNYYTNKIEQHKDDIKNKWKILKHAIGRTHKTVGIDKVNMEGTEITGLKQIAERCNEHFVAIG